MVRKVKNELCTCGHSYSWHEAIDDSVNGYRCSGGRGKCDCDYFERDYEGERAEEQEAREKAYYARLEMERYER